MHFQTIRMHSGLWEGTVLAWKRFLDWKFWAKQIDFVRMFYVPLLFASLLQRIVNSLARGRLFLRRNDLIVFVYLMRWISWLWWLWWGAWCMNGTLMRWCWMIWMSVAISWRWPWMIWPMIWSTCTRRCWITLRVWNLSWWILKCFLCEFVIFLFRCGNTFLTTQRQINKCMCNVHRKRFNIYEYVHCSFIS